MNIVEIILWSGLILLLVAGLLLSLVASRRPTAGKPGTHWLVVPVVVLVIMAIIFVAVGGAPTSPMSGFIVAATVLLLLIGVVAGSPLVLVVLELAGSGTVPLGDHGGILVPDTGAGTGTGTGNRKNNREILRGGMTIGYLERLAIIGAAFVGQYAAVAIVVAIKGLGRFSELENSAARERFIIGTLVSTVWAAACAAPAVLAWVTR